MVSTAAFHARVRGLVRGLGGLKETKMFLPHPCVKLSMVWNLRDREVACSAQTARARISNPVSGGQCHLTILRRFSWPSLAYMCSAAHRWPKARFISQTQEFRIVKSLCERKVARLLSDGSAIRLISILSG